MDACDRCGDCTVSGLLELRDRFGVEMKIVTGGTTARKIVREKVPEFIMAVACPRDMASGILDSYPIPVYAQLNVLKCGECFDTWVNVEDMEKTLEKYL